MAEGPMVGRTAHLLLQLLNVLSVLLCVLFEELVEADDLHFGGSKPTAYFPTLRAEGACPVGELWTIHGGLLFGINILHLLHLLWIQIRVNNHSSVTAEMAL